MKLRGLLGFAAAYQNLVTATFSCSCSPKEEKKNPNNPTDKKGAGLTQRHKIQNSENVFIPIPLAENRKKKKPPLQNMSGVTMRMPDI